MWSIGHYRYEIDDTPLGAGGVGIVYRGWDPQLGRGVVVKKIRYEASTIGMQERINIFRTEGMALAKLRHANIVTIYDLISDEGVIYIIMEFVDGLSLDKLIDDKIPNEVAVQKRLALFRQILRAMQYAHSQGVIHRDLKPSNIMVDKEGQVKILDFGLAILKDNNGRTDAGVYAYTPPYASPEQIKDCRNTDERTDIYSLGAILYELLTGEVVFSGQSRWDIEEQTLRDPAPSVQVLNPWISDELSAVVARCLEKDPSKRFQSVQELIDKFKACPEQNSKKAKPDDQDYAKKRVGERFRFGRYPQGVNDEVKPIIWRVLERDSNSLLVISERGLDAKPYNEKCCDVTWADCTLRRWLNGEFLGKAFSEQEQSLIQTSEIPNNAGLPTEDRIFLLSVDEVSRFLADGNDYACKPTHHAAKNGAGSCWWLRSRGHTSCLAAYVYSRSGTYTSGGNVADLDGAVRPALRLAISTTHKGTEGSVNSAPKAEEIPGSAATAGVENCANELILEKARLVIEKAIGCKGEGELFPFGHYPQGANGEVMPITWRVLQCETDSLLVISEKGLDVKRYDEKERSRTWSNCTLRHWLNEEFVKEAFSEQELFSILTSKIQNNAGADTEDRIFLLSIDEATSFFSSDKLTKLSVCKATDYALNRGADSHRGNVFWWLRSRGNNGRRAAGVDYDGDINPIGYNLDFDDVVVRPVLRLSISKLLFEHSITGKSS